MKRTFGVIVILIACSIYAAAQKLDVKGIDRQDKRDGYDYVAAYNNVAVGKSFKVNGAAFTLQLTDGRLAIVNCEATLQNTWQGGPGIAGFVELPW